MKRLTIKDVKKMIGVAVGGIGGVGTYLCKDVIENETEYIFQFEQQKMSGVVNKSIRLGRYSEDTDKAGALYAMRKGNDSSILQFVTADWFTFDNAVKALGERI